IRCCGPVLRLLPKTTVRYAERLVSFSQTLFGKGKFLPLTRRTLLKSWRHGRELPNQTRRNESTTFLPKLDKLLIKLAKRWHTQCTGHFWPSWLARSVRALLQQSGARSATTSSSSEERDWPLEE